jgi:predicted AlkP superfamily pyrophosphatase or phosphodiesterase
MKTQPPRLAVLNVVGLSRSLIGPHTPALSRFADRAGLASYAPAFPALTCTAQSSLLTGADPSQHGIVANGWYDRESAEVRFWKQSNHIVHGEKIWETLRRHFPGHTCAKLFWWYNMYSSADWSITPRPLYPADGRKIFDIHTQPMGLREEIKQDLGPFPFPAFWGPRAGIESSRWIAASARWIEERHQPHLNLVYLPHLDYPLQKLGPHHPEIPSHLQAIDTVVGDLIDFFEARSIRVLILSEYGISPVSRAIHPNRLFRQQGWLSLKNELDRETLDCGGCRAFAIADHQVAHIYLNDPSLRLPARALLEAQPGVAQVLDAESLYLPGPGRQRAGDLIAVASPDSWFTYYYWQDDARAPDFARTVDIHRKPGYDPCELFLDPSLRFPAARVGWFLLKKRLGLRGLLEVVPLDPSLVRGSHGIPNPPEAEQPVLLGSPLESATPAGVHQAILRAAGL